MDERWKNVVFPKLPELVEVLDPAEISDRLFAAKLVSVDQYHWFRNSSTSRRDRSRILLVDILPQKGRKAFDDFVKVLEKIEGQQHIVRDVLKLRNTGEKKTVEQEFASEDVNKIKNLQDELLKRSRELAEAKGKLARRERELGGEKAMNVGLRNKLSVAGYRRDLIYDCTLQNGKCDIDDLKWKMMKEMPHHKWLSDGHVAEINNMIHVGNKKTMFRLKNGEWEKKAVGFDIRSVFECDEKGYLVDDECKKIYEWQNEIEDIKLIQEIPKEYQIQNRSSIGYKGKIYFVEWSVSKCVSYFDIDKEKWEVTKEMKNRWEWCSLAVIHDKMFIGGVWKEVWWKKWHNAVECYLIKEDRWIDIKSTSYKECQLTSWNGKLVATGGYPPRNVVELYDELSGEWLRLPSMNKERWGHGACSTNDNKLVVVGGINAMNSVEYLKISPSLLQQRCLSLKTRLHEKNFQENFLNLSKQDVRLPMSKNNFHLQSEPYPRHATELNFPKLFSKGIKQVYENILRIFTTIFINRQIGSTREMTQKRDIALFFLRKKGFHSELYNNICFELVLAMLVTFEIRRKTE